MNPTIINERLEIDWEYASSNSRRILYTLRSSLNAILFLLYWFFYLNELFLPIKYIYFLTAPCTIFASVRHGLNQHKIPLRPELSKLSYRKPILWDINYLVKNTRLIRQFQISSLLLLIAVDSCYKEKNSYNQVW